MLYCFFNNFTSFCGIFCNITIIIMFNVSEMWMGHCVIQMEEHRIHIYTGNLKMVRVNHLLKNLAATSIIDCEQSLFCSTVLVAKENSWAVGNSRATRRANRDCPGFMFSIFVTLCYKITLHILHEHSKLATIICKIHLYQYLSHFF